jgi:acyl-CoA thioesterase
VEHPDLEWLGLRREAEGRWRFALTSPLSRLDMKFYGGTGVAVAVTTMEVESGRPAIWTSVQFVGSADTGDVLDVEVEHLASGRRTSQMRVTGSVDDRIVFLATGSTAALRNDEDDLWFDVMPDAGSPGDGVDWATRLPFAIGEGRPGWLAITEMTMCELPGGGFGLWARMRDRPLSRAALGFLADVVPMGIMRAAGRMGGGTSLDNHLRFGAEPRGDWVLVELDPHLLTGGYGHGSARLWSADGALLGVASQTASMRTFG